MGAPQLAPLFAGNQFDKLKMRTTKIWRASSPLLLGLGILATVAQVTAKGEEAIDEAYNNGSTNYGGNNWFERTTLGGYGELHLNLNSDKDNAIDFHRWVLFVNHRFNDRITLNSELELEHSLSGDGKPGEVELEQAYIDMAFDGGMHLKAGLFLVPVGTLNERHEPDTFYGVERNPVEKNIIPSTWWEAGLALSKSTEGGLSWDLAVHSGLKTDAFSIRGGRQKVAKAVAEDAAATARVTYSGISGVNVSAFANYQSDITQGGGADASALLLGATADVQMGAFRLRGLVASWDIDGAAAAAAGKDDQWGYYIEPSYGFDIGNGKMGVFARYHEWDTGGGEIDSVSVGVNYWPVDHVVFKGDYTDEDGNDSFNLGMGYSF